MNTLKNQTLLFDDQCPLCQVYTKGFIKTKMLDDNGRKAFQNISQDELQFVDLNRAVNEIALIDTNSKTVIYGVDSLLRILGNQFPWIEKIGTTEPIHFTLLKLYSFISYNRKVIIPSEINYEHQIQCVPKFNLKYRLLYILFCLTITTIVLLDFSQLMTTLPEFSMYEIIFLMISHISFQSAFLLKKDFRTVIDYIGNLMTISLMGSLFLVLLLTLNSIINIPEFMMFNWLGLTVSTMFIEHSRRLKVLALPPYLSYTWSIYIIFILVLILNIIS